MEVIIQSESAIKMMSLVPDGLYQKNEAFVIVDRCDHIVNFPSFKDKRRRSYMYSTDNTPPNEKSCFRTFAEAHKAFLKSVCHRFGGIKKITFENTDVSQMYNGEGANILGYDFIGGRIWIQSKDGSKYGYDYRDILLDDANTQLVVFEENVLGYIKPIMPHTLYILHSSILRGAISNNGFDIHIDIHKLKDIRLASEKDFEDYRVCFSDGYKDNKEYDYAK